MPIDYFKPLNSLRNLPGSALSSRFAGGGNDPSLEGYDLAGQLRSEAEENAISAQRAGAGRDAQAFDALSRLYKGDMDQSPITKQKAFLDEAESANQAAMRQGFGIQDLNSPSQRAGQYERQLETAKAMAPLEVARTNAQTALANAQTNAQAELAKQQEATRGVIEAAKINQKPYDQFFGAISGEDGRGLQPGDTASMGGMSFHRGGVPHAANVNPLYTQLATARQALQQSQGGISGLFGGGSGQQAKVDQLVAAIIAQHPADNGIKNIARQIASDPEDKNLSFAQILPKIGGLPPDKVDQLRDLLSVLRGKDF